MKLLKIHSIANKHYSNDDSHAHKKKRFQGRSHVLRATIHAAIRMNAVPEARCTARPLAVFRSLYLTASLTPFAASARDCSRTASRGSARQTYIDDCLNFDSAISVETS
ncbi:hypothetical protein ElyMa_003969700 [Elysia marginata]|uniref:Uncharacterized protein n=1 Tax=Elysia marginata TaxID=1093978 RepID=A0AAV4FYT7_9GAST|nr:hypothetical protein ElyMa_003969700 [Elysia marginata]